MSGATIERSDAAAEYSMAILQAMTEMLIVVSPRGVILAVNSATCRALGYEDVELVGRSAAMLFEAEGEEAALTKLAQEGTVTRIEKALRRRDGSSVPVLLTVSVVYDDQRRMKSVVCLASDIAERKEAEEALRKERHRLESLMRAIPAPVFFKDREGRYLGCNTAFETLTGTTLEEIVGKTVHEVWPEKYSETYRDKDLELLETGGVQRYEYALVDAQGEKRDVVFHKRVFDGHSGSAAGIVGVILDITEHKRDLEQLQRAREQLQLAVQGANDGIWDWDLRTNDLYLSPRWKGQLGYADHELPHVLSTFEQLLWPEDRTRVFDHVERYFKGEVPLYDLEFRMQHKDGSCRWIRGRGVALRDENGVPYRMAGSHTDTTESKRAEQALQASEDRFRLILSNVPVGILVIGHDRLVRWANRYALQNTGFAFEEIVGSRCDMCMCATPEGGCPILDLGEVLQQSERHMRCKDGSVRPILKNVFRVELGGEPVLLETFVDMTDYRRIENELSNARKLEAVGQLAAGIAHEINTPTQFVGDSIEFLKEAFDEYHGLLEEYREAMAEFRGAPAYDAVASKLREAEAGADLDYFVENVGPSFDRCAEGLSRIASIVRAMKDFGHPDAREKSFADLNRALTATLTIARNEYKYVAEVETEFGELPPVLCHVGDLNQVFLNLIVNAAHAIAARGIESKGRIRLRTRLEDPGTVCIEVQDSGSGIPPAIRDRIFDPFFTTKPVGKGTGQGLAIARSIVVDKHRGSITFATDPDEGTTFYVRLPTGAVAMGEPS